MKLLRFKRLNNSSTQCLAVYHNPITNLTDRQTIVSPVLFTPLDSPYILIKTTRPMREIGQVFLNNIADIIDTKVPWSIQDRLDNSERTL